MNKFLLILLGSVFMGTVHAQDITSCQNPKGNAFYHFHGLVNQSKSGWSEDKITGGITTLKLLPDGKYDILIVDARKSVISFRQDGGEILLLRKGRNDATFLYVHPGMAVEVYTFWRDPNGRNRFDMLQSKGGDGLQVHKSSVMVGDCSEINFNLIR